MYRYVTLHYESSSQFRTGHYCICLLATFLELGVFNIWLDIFAFVCLVSAMLLIYSVPHISTAVQIIFL